MGKAYRDTSWIRSPAQIQLGSNVTQPDRRNPRMATR
jgi:hypothetical protein